MYNIDTHIFMGVYSIYVNFCNSDNIVNGYIFSNDIFVFPSYAGGQLESNRVHICIYNLGQ